MKETTGTNYKNPLTDERQEIGTDERKSGNYVNPQAKLRDTKKDEITKNTCKCEMNETE